jgi:uncharacterized protein
MPGKSVGLFAWYDLVTHDAQAAASFYSEVVGWKKQPWAEGDYTLFAGDQGLLGGVIQRQGRPPQWISYVLVDDVDATAAKVKELGGRIYVPPTDMAGVGRFAVFADPQGASISLFKPTGDPVGLHDGSKYGEFDWNELLTTDHEQAFAFYSAIFGWQKLLEQDQGAMGKYLIYGIGDRQLGGMSSKTMEMQDLPAAWTYYINVSDLDEATRLAVSKGGKVVQGPMAVPDGSRVARLADPQGAGFALHEPKK